MPRDRIEIQAAGKRLTDFTEYRVESSLFQAADSFTVDLAAPVPGLHSGQMCQLFVNGRMAMTGLIDSVPQKTRKRRLSLSLAGRDLMGLLVDTSAMGIGDQEETGLKELAETLLANVPFINRKKVVFDTGAGDKSRAAELTKEEDFEFSNVTPGESIFEALKKKAMAKGLLFYALPDGTFVFGRPKTSGKPEFKIRNNRAGTGNNAIEGDYEDDLSPRHSRVVVLEEGQGMEDVAAGGQQKQGFVEDPDFPFEKPFLASVPTPGGDPEAYARILMDRQRFDGFRLSYLVAGHSQKGKNWTVNAVCKVEDDIMEASGLYLIHERVFLLDKERGPVTRVRLSKLGVLPA